jgi:hypothetical protein
MNKSQIQYINSYPNDYIYHNKEKVLYLNNINDIEYKKKEYKKKEKKSIFKKICIYLCCCHIFYPKLN